MKVTLKAITPDAEVNIVEIARVSSSRKDKSEAPEGLVNYLIKNKHWSPFEHSFMTVEIVTSKAIAIQLLRHRSFTFQEFSQRYAKVTDMEPIELRMQAETNRQSSTDVTDPLITLPKWPETTEPQPASRIVSETIEHIQTLYNTLVDAGVAKECARFILPMTTQTTLHMTGSVRSWIHMLDIRDDSHAQLEAQLIAKEIKRIFIEECPIIANARGWIQQKSPMLDGILQRADQKTKNRPYL